MNENALHVPGEALEEHTYQHRHTDDPTDHGVRRIAAPVVAAELRRLADELERFVNEERDSIDQRDRPVAYRAGVADSARRVRDRADQLDTRGERDL